MRQTIRVLVLVFLPACSRCTGEDLPPMAEAPPAPSAATTVAAAAEGAEGDAGRERTIRGHAGDITIKGAPSAVINPQLRRRNHP